MKIGAKGTKASGTEGVSSGQVEFCNCNNKYNKKNGAITRTAYTKWSTMV